MSLWPFLAHWSLLGPTPWAVGRGPWSTVCSPWAVCRGPQSVGAIGDPLGPNLMGTQGCKGTINWPRVQDTHLYRQGHQDQGLPKDSGEAHSD
ncbi:hypothetical protein O181_132624 [Austropuccinia psidii MF-1]|uniref:Secreted protein n=1 Tax=Austropuccinia psidii MF-1 TaxID=1389203 RepID=A0A9Q3QC88_9BASI|nr:hypothetical protein [Austropuccinia psidii MF-1]